MDRVQRTVPGERPGATICSIASLVIYEGTRVLTAYSRVTVVTAERKVDLALPSALPVAEVVPQVLRYCAPPDADGLPVSWTLARLGGQSLSLGQTLSDAGVLDGDVLELRSQQTHVSPVMVEDVRDAVEDSADAAGGAWTPRTTFQFVALTGAAVFTVLAGIEYVAPGQLGGSRAAGLASVVSGAVLWIAATAWADYVGHPRVAQVCAAVAMVWGYLSGLAVGDSAEIDAWVTVVTAMAAMTVVAGAARLITPVAMGHLATAVVLLVASAVHAACGELSFDQEQTQRIIPVAALLSAGVIPRLSLSVGGLASADYRVRHIGQMSRESLRARFSQSNAILVGSLVAISVIAVWGALQLTFHHNAWDRYLALSIGVATILRSRVFSRTQHMVVLRLAGVVVLAGALVRLRQDIPETAPWVVAILIGAVVVAVAISSLSMSEITRARVKRTLNIVEFLVVVDLIVLLCGATGVFVQLGDLV